MLQIEPRDALLFTGSSSQSPHKMKSKLGLYNPTLYTIFYRVRSTHSVYYSLYVSPVSGKLLPGQSVDIHFSLPSIASVKHSAEPLRFVIQTTVPGPDADLRTLWKYVHYLDVMEIPIRVKILPSDEDVFTDIDTSDEEGYNDDGYLFSPLAIGGEARHLNEENEVPSCSYEAARNETILALVTENQALRARVLSLEKTIDIYDDVIRNHTTLIEENTRLRERLEKLENNSQLPFNCCVCLEEKPNTILFPCRHVIMCGGCAAKCGTCPTCRSIIQSKVNVYF